ncbi:hypothetical protein [Chitinivorax sp. B]|uniref:hypothetical protein n=1 Tax=Chitinivorax sp. B TaxID=2502235 RepID=UPI0020172171|nr:hypothetical protein [Chitinivorax sp. B]
MPVFAYQSLNSNASIDHGVGASKSQYFTRVTHDHSAKISSGGWMLSLPINPNLAPDIPLYGPAQLLPTAAQGYMNKGQHDDITFRDMVQRKALQTHQNLIRAFGTGFNLLVYGELDSGHSDWASMQQSAGRLLRVSSAEMACNSFSVHADNQRGMHRYLGEGQGWIAVESYGVVAVFVHVPNAIATSDNKTIDFYAAINKKILQAGAGGIDIIMGDTNQASNGFTPKVVTSALGQSFEDAHPQSTIQPYDSYQRDFQGTNSTGTKKYDVAVYNRQTVKVKEMIYLTQFTPVSSQSSYMTAAVTDHMGVAVRVEKV